MSVIYIYVQMYIINVPVIGLLQSKVPGSGDHPLLPQVEVLTSLSPRQVKVSMDPAIVTGGVLVMITPAAVDDVQHTTVLRKRSTMCMHDRALMIRNVRWP